MTSMKQPDRSLKPDELQDGCREEAILTRLVRIEMTLDRNREQLAHVALRVGKLDSAIYGNGRDGILSDIRALHGFRARTTYITRLLLGALVTALGGAAVVLATR